jgi:hypothetical protein
VDLSNANWLSRSSVALCWASNVDSHVAVLPIVVHEHWLAFSDAAHSCVPPTSALIFAALHCTVKQFFAHTPCVLPPNCPPAAVPQLFDAEGSKGSTQEGERDGG